MFFWQETLMMTPIRRILPISVCTLIASFALAGCAGIDAIPDTNITTQITPAPIRGSVYGGHAPLVGAHVYLLQPGTSGFGSQATSLLGVGTGVSAPAGFPLSTNTGDPNIPTTWQYVTTDSTGSFNLSGAYTCTANQPVYLYAYGGTPSTVPLATPASYTVSNLTISNTSGTGAAQTALFTATVTSTELLFAGEEVTLSGFTGNFAYLNGSLQIVDSPKSSPGAVLTTTTFSFTAGTYNGSANVSGSNNISGTVTAQPQANPSVVNLAVLGDCPANAPFNFGSNSADPISYIYVNEVSTVATAYAFQGFTSSANNDATHIGSSGSIQALKGAANAANVAAQLYNVTGKYVSTSFAGEGHIANPVTVARNGIVPQSTLDTLGNILAACVDSAPNVTGSTGSAPSIQCKTLFNTATADGTTAGTVPVDTATAAINIARHPAGVGNANFVSTLYNLPTGTVPFAPNLTKQPNDFTIAIQYPTSGTSAAGTTVTNGYVGDAESVAVDGTGNVWVTSQTGHYVVQLNAVGVQQTSNNTTYSYGYVSLDPSNNAWSGNVETTSGITEGFQNGSFNYYNPPQYYDPYTIVTDKNGNVFVGAAPSNGSNFHLYELNPSGVQTEDYAIESGGTGLYAGGQIAHGAIDSAGYLWLTTEGPVGHYQITRVLPGAANAFTVAANFPIGTSQQPEFPAIDKNNTAWIPVQQNPQMDKVTAAGTLTNPTGATLNDPFGSAIDGAGNVWITNRQGTNSIDGSVGSIVEYNAATSTAISPGTNNYTLGGTLSCPLNVAFDLSGNLWITNYNFQGNCGPGEVVQMVGAAPPVALPLSYAAGAGKLGQTP
jgi:hypothetical protein